MALRQKLTKPLIVDPLDDYHTHTVVFLHRFPEETTEEEVASKVVSQRLTKNHKTLRVQFPSVRWVFPYAKAHARPWNNLSAEDRAAVGMEKTGPYITQVVLQEAEVVGGLDRIFLGGQGEAAEAAHEAMASFPECRSDDPDEVAAFLRKNFHHPTWTRVEELRLAGFVGMHREDGELTRDVKNRGIMLRTASSDGRPKVNQIVGTNTPHRFINGGYKVQNLTWDGRRIDDFAAFLELVGVPRLKEPPAKPSSETLAPKERKPNKKFDPRESLDDMQRHALEVEEQKKLDAARRALIMVRIEADKVERKFREDRERARRLHAAEDAGDIEQRRKKFAPSINRLGGAGEGPVRHSGGPEDDFSPTSENNEEPEHNPVFKAAGTMKARREVRRANDRTAGHQSAEWEPPSTARGEMRDSQLAALNVKTKDD